MTEVESHAKGSDKYWPVLALPLWSQGRSLGVLPRLLVGPLPKLRQDGLLAEQSSHGEIEIRGQVDLPTRARTETLQERTNVNELVQAVPGEDFCATDGAIGNILGWDQVSKHS